MALKDSQYVPLRQYDVDEGKSFYSDSPNGTDESLYPLVVQFERKAKATTSVIHRWEWFTRGALLFLSAVFFALWILSGTMRKCTYVEKYSPANEAIDYVEHVKYIGSLHFTTPWRGDESGDPGPDIDAAWRRISTDVKPVRVTEEQLHKMGMKITQTTVMIPEEDGGGYLAALEVNHHLQCLDMLRKATYREYYESFDPTFQVGDEALMTQLDTCIEVIRQALMCYPDTDMMLYYWVRGHELPFPDITAPRRCKNFDKILDWASPRGVDIERISSLHMNAAVARM